MNNEKIIENLMNISNQKNSLKEVNKKRGFWNRNGILISFSEKEHELFKEVADYILDEQYIKENFPVSYIEDKLKDIISEAASKSVNEKKNFIEEKVNALRDDMKNDIKEWIFQIPVENIKIYKDIKIGNVKLFTFNNEKLINTKEKYLKSHASDFMVNNFENYLNKVFAEVKVITIKKYAKILAIKEINLALNCLKLFIHQDNASFGINGNFFTNVDRFYLLYSDFNDWLLSDGYLGQLIPFNLDEESFKFMKQNGFDKLNDLLIKKNSAYETRILNSIFWFGEALSLYIDIKEDLIENKKHENLEHFKFGEKVIKLCTALESILTFDKEEPIRENISERAALILGKEYSDRINIKRNIKRIYDIRSSIVHNGDVFVSKYYVKYLSDVVRYILYKLIDSSGDFYFKSIEEFRDYIDELKYSN